MFEKVFRYNYLRKLSSKHYFSNHTCPQSKLFNSTWQFSTSGDFLVSNSTSLFGFTDSLNESSLIFLISITSFVSCANWHFRYNFFNVPKNTFDFYALIFKTIPLIKCSAVECIPVGPKNFLTLILLMVSNSIWCPLMPLLLNSFYEPPNSSINWDGTSGLFFRSEMLGPK